MATFSVRVGEGRAGSDLRRHATDKWSTRTNGSSSNAQGANTPQHRACTRHRPPGIPARAPPQRDARVDGSSRHLGVAVASGPTARSTCCTGREFGRPSRVRGRAEGRGGDGQDEGTQACCCLDRPGSRRAPRRPDAQSCDLGSPPLPCALLAGMYCEPAPGPARSVAELALSACTTGQLERPTGWRLESLGGSRCGSRMGSQDCSGERRTLRPPSGVAPVLCRPSAAKPPCARRGRAPGRPVHPTRKKRHANPDHA